jgi:hypothetical protein
VLPGAREAKGKVFSKVLPTIQNGEPWRIRTADVTTEKQVVALTFWGRMCKNQGVGRPSVTTP